MLSAMASGTSVIKGLSPGLDVQATGVIMGQLGASVHYETNEVVVKGRDECLLATDEALDCGNSGTTMRLLCGVVSAIDGEHRLVGDSSLSKRPMDRVATPLHLMGANVRGQGERVTAPLLVTGHTSLRSVSYHVPTPSAQVKSAILIAGLHASGPTVVVEDVRTRSTTEDMLRLAGIAVESRDEGDGRIVTVQPGRPVATSWSVPGDPSQAAFFCVLGAVHADARLEIVDVDPSPERTGFVSVLQRMGAKLTVQRSAATVTLVSESSELVGTEIHANEIPSVDEVPALAVAAAAARGISAFRDMGELRLKESDRFEGSMQLASALGCRVWSEGDDFFVEGLGDCARFSDFTLDAGLDHRLVMSSAVAGTAGNGCSIKGADTVASSYPHFFQVLASLA
jgi:3-phosphoshikimate 1-carboxyvinyltransferase